jgi:hypothetical protein
MYNELRYYWVDPVLKIRDVHHVLRFSAAIWRDFDILRMGDSLAPSARGLSLPCHLGENS